MFADSRIWPFENASQFILLIKRRGMGFPSEGTNGINTNALDLYPMLGLVAMQSRECLTAGVFCLAKDAAG